MRDAGFADDDWNPEDYSDGDEDRKEEEPPPRPALKDITNTAHTRGRGLSVQWGPGAHIRSPAEFGHHIHATLHGGYQPPPPTDPRILAAIHAEEVRKDNTKAALKEAGLPEDALDEVRIRDRDTKTTRVVPRYEAAAMHEKWEAEDEAKRKKDRLDNESGADKFFRKVNTGLRSVADVAVKVLPIPGVVKAAYGAFRPSDEALGGALNRTLRGGGTKRRRESPTPTSLPPDTEQRLRSMIPPRVAAVDALHVEGRVADSNQRLLREALGLPAPAPPPPAPAPPAPAPPAPAPRAPAPRVPTPRLSPFDPEIEEIINSLLAEKKAEAEAKAKAASAPAPDSASAPVSAPAAARPQERGSVSRARTMQSMHAVVPAYGESDSDDDESPGIHIAALPRGFNLDKKPADAGAFYEKYRVYHPAGKNKYGKGEINLSPGMSTRGPHSDYIAGFYNRFKGVPDHMLTTRRTHGNPRGIMRHAMRELIHHRVKDHGTREFSLFEMGHYPKHNGNRQQLRALYQSEWGFKPEATTPEAVRLIDELRHAFPMSASTEDVLAAIAAQQAKHPSDSEDEGGALCPFDAQWGSLYH